jgi:hypothetical protein
MLSVLVAGDKVYNPLFKNVKVRVNQVRLNVDMGMLLQ